MSDKELISMIVDKIDNLKEDINSRLDKHEEKLDAQTEKLNSFEVRAESVLAAHDKDIVHLKKEVDELKVKTQSKNDTTPNILNWFISFSNGPIATTVFRYIMMFFLAFILLIVGIDPSVVSSKIKKAMEITITNTELVKEPTDTKK